MKIMTALGLAFGLALAPISLAAADEFSPAQKKEMGEFIKDYLVKNPEALRAAIDALDKSDKQAAETARRHGHRVSGIYLALMTQSPGAVLR